jgi:flagellar biogenesis protein FliO
MATRKRPVSSKRSAVRAARPAPIVDDELPAKRSAFRVPRSASVIEEEPAPQRPGFRLPRTAPIIDDDESGSNYALRLTEALEAISAAQGSTTSPTDAARGQQPKGVTRNAERGTFARWLKALDKMPPIRLPIGPPIPWRIGLPCLVAIVAVLFVVGRPSGRADAQGVRLPTQDQAVRLPAQETYAVQQEAPLFAATPQTQPQAQTPAQAPTQPQAAPSLGAPEPAATGFDFFDVGFKLVAVLALAYASLTLLKRVGIGGASAARTGGTIQGMRVVSTLALAPNRSVHVLKVPGGRTLLVGATPNQVNLIADLGELAETETPDAASFFDVLKGKIGS